jgi:hypothetical protein
MKRGRVTGALGVAWLACLPLVVAMAGDKAQTSGALRPDEVSGARLQSEAERVGTMNKLLRNRQFDVFRAGNSLGGAIDVSLPTPSTPIPNLDPKAQQRLIEEYDRKKNWLAEPGAIRPREVDTVDTDRRSKQSGDENIPNFSRERGRSRRSRDDSAQNSDFDDNRSGEAVSSRRVSRLSSDDVRNDGRSPRTERDSNSRDLAGIEAVSTRSISEILAPEADHRTWFRANPTYSSGSGTEGTFSFKGTASGVAGGGPDGFAGPPGSPSGATLGNAASISPLVDPVGPPPGFDGDPGRRFDPTVAPGSAFSAPDSGGFPRSAFGPAAANPGGGGGSFGGGSAGRGFEGSVKSFFSAPAGSDAASAIRSSPSFTPRPAVLSFPQQGPF